MGLMWIIVVKRTNGIPFGKYAYNIKQTKTILGIRTEVVYIMYSITALFEFVGIYYNDIT